MANENKTAYPLFWPDGRPRTQVRKTQPLFKTTFAKARDACMEEIRRLGGTDIVVSTNIKLKPDGTPYAVDWGKWLPDPGVAVFFKRKGKEMCFACDCWNHVQDNMHAIALTIAALRGIARWGTGDMMEAAFRGFAALPAPGESSGDRPWEVLGVAINATEAQLLEAYRLLAKKFHPDIPETGDVERFRRIQDAYNMMAQNVRKDAA